MIWDLLVDIATFSVIAFGLLFFVVQLGAFECGFRFGRRHMDGKSEPPAGVGLVVGGLLGLLGFVLALTLSQASSRFEERRMGTLAEANAIGTAWLRARAMNQQEGDEIARKLAEYTQQRIAFVHAGRDARRIEELNAQANTVQTDIWNGMIEIARQRQDPLAGHLMAALNETFDRATAERFAFAYTIPPQLLWLIIGLAIVSIASVGYQLGHRGVALRPLAMLLIGTWTLVATLILDLGSPRIGNIRTSIAAYEWTLSGFGSGATGGSAPRGR